MGFGLEINNLARSLRTKGLSTKVHTLLFISSYSGVYYNFVDLDQFIIDAISSILKAPIIVYK